MVQIYSPATVDLPTHTEKRPTMDPIYPAACDYAFFGYEPKQYDI
jgi:hypothetical protein